MVVFLNANGTCYFAGGFRNGPPKGIVFSVSAAKHNENDLFSKLTDGPNRSKSAHPKSHMAVKTYAKLKKTSSGITLNEKTMKTDDFE